MSNPKLPVRLGAGHVSIYGAPSTYGFQTNQPIQFGTINQLYDSVPTSVQLNDSVMFDLNDARQVVYGSIPYFIVPIDKIILIENAVVPLP